MESNRSDFVTEDLDEERQSAEKPFSSTMPITPVESTSFDYVDLLTAVGREAELSKLWKKPDDANMQLVHDLLRKGLPPRYIVQSLAPSGCMLPEGLPDTVILGFLFELLEENRLRKRRPEFHDFTQAVQLFNNSKRILIITGAGVSVSCGIPDFRSATGIYASLKKKFPDLPRPTSMFDIDFFKRRPEPFFSFAKEIFPGLYKPSISHMFIKFLDEQGKLLRNYTQNIDTLERVAGIKNIVECHGSFATATCLHCKSKFTCDDIREDVYAQNVSMCSKCDVGVIKPDIVFFGEDLPDLFHQQMGQDRDQADLVVVIGSSLRVQPVSLIPHHIDENVPQILVNRENLRQYDADIKLLGNCDEVVIALAMAMGGEIRDKMIEELKTREEYEGRLHELELIVESEKQCHRPFAPTVMSAENFMEQYVTPSDHNSDDGDVVPNKKFKPSEAEGHVAGIENVHSQMSEEQQHLCDMQSLWESNFVSVAEKLTGFMYAKFPPNLNIFKGADFYYDRDSRGFTGLPNKDEDGPSENSDDEGSESNYSITRTRSLPAELSMCKDVRSTSVSEPSCSSCPEYFCQDDDGSP